MQHGYKVMIYASDGQNDRALEYVGMLKGQSGGRHHHQSAFPRARRAAGRQPSGRFLQAHQGRPIADGACDNHMGGRMAAEELLASGSKRPVMIAAVHDKLLPAYDRFVGFCSVMREHGLEERIFETKENDSLHGDYSKLARQVLDTFPDADGVFCTSDQIAASVVRCAAASGGACRKISA
ncbi:MAG: substrate-binding domain-containing protein [Christensenellales bacterium]